MDEYSTILTGFSS